MAEKSQIENKKNDIWKIGLIILIPLLLIYIVEHFGSFNIKSYGGTYETATVSNSSFKTPFGNTVKISNDVLAYKRQSDGTYVTLAGGSYFDKMPYYFKGVLRDIIYPIILIGILLIGYFLKKYLFNQNNITTKKTLNISGKSLPIFLLILLLGVSVFGYWKYLDYENKLSWLESENYDLTDEIDNLESERDDLQSELDDAIEEKERTENLYEVMSANYDNLIEAKTRYSNYDSYNSSSSYGNSYSNDGADIDLPKSLSTSYLDGGYIIKPDFGNLHLLLKMSQSDFENKMRSNNYSLTTTKESYISNNTKNVYCTIDKEWNSVAMIITDSYNSDIESFFNKNEIDYKYEDGAKVYYYTFGSTSYSLLVKKTYDSFLALLKKT